jgi:hypothetical protein
VQVAKQAMTPLHASSGNISRAYPYRMWPLLFLKQIVVMFFSACGPSLQVKNPDLVRFALNRDERQFLGVAISIRTYEQIMICTKLACCMRVAWTRP